MNPWFAIGLGVIWLLSLAGAFAGGVRVEGDHRDAQQLTQERAFQTAYQAKGAKLNTVADKFEGKRVEIRTVTKTITQAVDRIVDRPVYLSACFDDDGLRAANAALTGVAPDPGQPDAGMPAAGAPR